MREKDDDGRRHIADVAFDRLLEILPRDLEQPHRQPDGHTGREKQGNLARPEDGVAAEYADVQRQKRHEDQDWNQGYSHPEYGDFLHLCKSVYIPFSKWSAS